ncbi:MAG: hypothetical protein EBT75_11405 [Proteobacteria bacterium]|nr:hypothetical protein [Pseudomonadota bacterium]
MEAVGAESDSKDLIFNIINHLDKCFSRRFLFLRRLCDDFCPLPLKTKTRMEVWIGLKLDLFEFSGSLPDALTLRCRRGK